MQGLKVGRLLLLLFLTLGFGVATTQRFGDILQTPLLEKTKNKLKFFFANLCFSLLVPFSNLGLVPTLLSFNTFRYKVGIIIPEYSGDLNNEHSNNGTIRLTNF